MIKGFKPELPDPPGWVHGMLVVVLDERSRVFVGKYYQVHSHSRDELPWIQYLVPGRFLDKAPIWRVIPLLEGAELYPPPEYA